MIVHDLLRCFAQNAFDWILGKGLHVILHTVYKHLERFIKDEIMAHKDFYRCLIILGGSVASILIGLFCKNSMKKSIKFKI
jgi:hypothetical protein